MNDLLRAVFVAAAIIAVGCQAKASSTAVEGATEVTRVVAPVVVGDADPQTDSSESAQNVEFETVDLDPKSGALVEQLTVQAARAVRAGKRPHVEMRANWCPICKRVDKMLRNPELQADLGPVVVIRVDTDRFAQELADAGLTSETIPAFYELDRRGRPTDHWVNGHRWGPRADVPDKLRAFFAAQ